MKKSNLFYLVITSVIVLSFIIINFGGNPKSSVFAEETKAVNEQSIDEIIVNKDDEGYEDKFRLYKEEVLQDILTNYSQINLDGYTKVEATTVLPNLLQEGSMNFEVESLIDICWEKDNTVLGAKWLFVNGNEGYFFYKTPDGSNVVRTIKRTDGIWKLEKEQIKKGNIINWKEK
ncbi:hypothetical protein [Bacillus sp. FJAT-27251]|uniref:hypothetical protein n=1 Tax=Bacillus sp. FJAT-27251 TaxID=1684142 RepID=UPI0006A78145|nr:hypothetical protein [Bacillus sp. FJAT-27251]